MSKPGAFPAGLTPRPPLHSKWRGEKCGKSPSSSAGEGDLGGEAQIRDDSWQDYREG